MAPLTADERASLRTAAEQAGHDPDAFVAEAETMAEEVTPAQQAARSEQLAATKDVGPLKAERLLVGHFVYMTTNEIRDAIGLGPIVDGDIPSGQWLTRHGPPDGASAPSTPDDSGET